MKGKYNFANIMIDEIDEATKEQIQTFLNHPAFADTYIAIMPDCHAGKGAVVGFTMQMNNYIIPNLVGVDIGCGMLHIEYPLQTTDLTKLDEFIKKNFSKEEVDKLTDKEENAGMMGLMRDMFNHIIKKEAKAPTDDLYENGLETKVGKLKQQLEDAKTENKKLSKKLEKLEKKLETKDEDKEEDEKEAKDKKDDKKEYKDEKEDKEEQKSKDKDKEEKVNDKEAKTDKKDDEVIKKSLNIDEAKAAGRKGFMDEIGCDSMGRNKKYL
jgi:hypothetical protein